MFVIKLILFALRKEKVFDCRLPTRKMHLDPLERPIEALGIMKLEKWDLCLAFENPNREQLCYHKSPSGSRGEEVAKITWSSKKMEVGLAWECWTRAASCFGGLLPNSINITELASASSVEEIRLILDRIWREVCSTEEHFVTPVSARVDESTKRPGFWSVSYGSGRTRAVISGGTNRELRVSVVGPPEAASSIVSRIEAALAAGAVSSIPAKRFEWLVAEAASHSSELFEVIAWDSSPGTPVRDFYHVGDLVVQVAHIANMALDGPREI